MKKTKKTLTIVGVVILALIISIAIALVCFIFIPIRNVEYGIDYWQKLQEVNPFLPTVSEMGNYETISCKYQHREYFLSSSDAYILKATYSQEEFSVQKEYFDTKLSYQEGVFARTGDEIIERDASFTFDGYNFKMLSLEVYNLYYPKYFAFVGFSEERNAICFVFFDDLDLDFIDRSFEDFLIDECGWE